MKLITTIALAATLAAGAAFAGEPGPPFEVGVATQADVVKLLGKPMFVTHSKGDTILAYSKMHATVKPESFIPVVGLFAGGARTKTKTTTFTFGADGLLESIDTTDSEADCTSSIIGMGCK